MTPSNNASQITVRIARTEDHLQKARSVRALAYRRTAPHYADIVAKGDPMDYDPDAIVLLAESKQTGIPLASVRVESGRAKIFYPTENFCVPDRIKRSASAYICRLAAVPGRQGNRAKEFLIKAVHLYCLAMQYRWLILVAVPPRDRHYKILGFEATPEFPDLQPLPDTARKRGRVMVCDLAGLEREWRKVKHPYYDLIFASHSPEIEIFNSVRGAWLMPREDGLLSGSPPSLDGEIGLPLV